MNKKTPPDSPIDGLEPLWASWKKFRCHPGAVCLVALGSATRAAYNGDICLVGLTKPFVDLQEALLHLLAYAAYREHVDAHHNWEDRIESTCTQPDNARVANIAVIELRIDTADFGEIERALRDSMLASVSLELRA